MIKRSIATADNSVRSRKSPYPDKASQDVGSFSAVANVVMKEMERQRARSEVFGEDAHFSEAVKDFLYTKQSYLDDFDIVVSSKRTEKIGKYCIWKAKKWATKIKKYKNPRNSCNKIGKNLKSSIKRRN